MHRSARLLAVIGLVAGLLPTGFSTPAGAQHDGLPDCASERITGYIPVAQNDPLDKTTLHYQVFIPKTGADENGNYAAVMDYSGYQPGLHIWDGLHRHFTCEGYAVIGLNIRGTGCSGGSFDYFEPRQAEDGREAIEWLAAQNWSNGRIAMVGKSYPGITQLFVAGQPFDDDGDGTISDSEADTTPDGLVGIVPGHVFGDLYRDVPYPGGIMNVTFASYWSAGRIVEPFQAPIEDQMRRGTFDPECSRNTADHVANPPQNPFVKALYNQYDGELFHERSPWYWAENISVHTFLIESWQDEQVGSRATELIERFRSGLEWRFLGANGDHGEYYGEKILPKIFDFLRFYLAGQIPSDYQGTVEEPVPEPSPSPTSPSGKPKKSKKPHPHESPSPSPSPSTTTRPRSYDEALAIYETEDPVQINWENGAQGGRRPAWTDTYASWPPPNQTVWRLNLGADGELSPGEVSQGAIPYAYVPGQSQQRGYVLTDIEDQDIQVGHWSEHPEEGTYAMFETAPLEADKLLAGTASVDLTVSSTAPDTDFQVTLTEVRPDGQEMFVQQGWLRASQRELDPAQSTPLRPFQTHLVTDVQPLIPGVPAEVRIEIFPFAHAFRANSRIRVYVEAPHVKPDLWGFAIRPTPALNTILTPSSIALPLLDGATAQTPLPNCTLRNQPCRSVQP